MNNTIKSYISQQKKQKKFDFSIDIKLNLIYNKIIKGKEINDMSNKKKAKKKTLSAKDIIELVIKAMLAAAALIQSIKS